MGYKIKLTEAQVKMCQRLGISPAEYAKALSEDAGRRHKRNNKTHNITKG